MRGDGGASAVIVERGPTCWSKTAVHRVMCFVGQKVQERRICCFLRGAKLLDFDFDFLE